MADVGMALDRAREKTENMRARAAAIDELTERGLLEDPLEPGDPFNRELDKVTAAQNVQAELQRLTGPPSDRGGCRRERTVFREDPCMHAGVLSV